MPFVHYKQWIISPVKPISFNLVVGLVKMGASEAIPESVIQLPETKKSYSDFGARKSNESKAMSDRETDIFLKMNILKITVAYVCGNLSNLRPRLSQVSEQCGLLKACANDSMPVFDSLLPETQSMETLGKISNSRKNIEYRPSRCSVVSEQFGLESAKHKLSIPLVPILFPEKT